MERAPHMRMAVGVVVERSKARSPWAEFLWRPVAVFIGSPEAAPWTLLSIEGNTARFYAGACEIELHRTETENYSSNLASAAPSVWIALRETGGDPPCDIMAATVDPAEGEALTEPAQAIIEAVPMPRELHDMVAAFIAAYHVERVFEKRQRDRANPDALARHGPQRGNQS